MNNEKGIIFLKNKIRERLLSVADQMGKQRYKLYLAMVEECNNFEDLKEMAELDLQMELFDYIKSEITPKLDEMNMSISDIRRLDVGEYPALDTPTQHFDIDPSDLESLMDDPEANAAMAMLLMSRINNEPVEERYRQEILDFQLEEKISVDSIDDIEDDEELGGLLEEEEDDEVGEDDEDFGSLLDSEDDESEESETSDSEEYDESDAGEYFTDDEVDTGIMTEDEIFDDSSDDDDYEDLSDLMAGLDDEIETGIMSEDEIFEKEIDELGIEGLDDGFIDEDDEISDKDAIDSINELEGYDFGELETDDNNSGLEDIDDIDDFDGLENIGEELDETDESDESDESDGYSSIDDIEDDGFIEDEHSPFDDNDTYDPFGDINDAEVEAMIEESDEESDPFDAIDDSELGYDEDDSDPFSNIDIDEIGEEDADDSDNDDDPFADIDSIGLIDDSDELLGNSSTALAPTKPANAALHTPDKPTRQSGIKPTTVFRDGTSRGDKSQEMFDIFNNIGIGTTKFVKNVRKASKKVVGSKTFDKIASMGLEDIDIDF